MRNKGRPIGLALGLLILTFSALTYARVFTYIPNVPWSMERINAPAGREFVIYCQLFDTWGMLGFRQVATKKCTFYAVGSGNHIICHKISPSKVVPDRTDKV